MKSEKKFTQHDVGKFVVKHYPRAREWDFEHLCNWIAWNMGEGFCMLVGDGRKLAGILLLRPVMNPQACIGNRDFDPEGDTLLVDLAVTAKPKREILQCLAIAVLKRFGQRSKLAFQKHAVGPIFITDAIEHRRKLLRERKTVPV